MELSIFTTILLNTRKQNISIFKRFKRKVLNLDESTYILSLKTKLTKLHILKKRNLQLYNRDISFDLTRTKVLFMASISKVVFNIDGSIIH
jgi:hypothetical protein